MTSLAFDTRVRPHTSFARVLSLLQHAANKAGIAFESWQGGACSADVLWSPQMKPPSVVGPQIITSLYDVNPTLPCGPVRRIREKHRRMYRSLMFRRKVWYYQARSWRFVTCSEDARMRLASNFPKIEERLRVVPLYAASHFQPEDDGHDSEHRDDFGLGERYLLYVGALRRHKNWQGLLRAFALLPRALRREHPLVLVGRTHRVGRELRRLLCSLHIGDDVRLIEKASEEELPALYRGAAVFVFPSFAEGFGLPPLEAMACGVPVVASNRTSLPEVLGWKENDPEHSPVLLVDPTDTEKIAEAIENVLTSEHKAERLHRYGLLHASTTYNPARTAAAMSALLAEFRS